METLVTRHASTQEDGPKFLGPYERIFFCFLGLTSGLTGRRVNTEVTNICIVTFLVLLFSLFLLAVVLRIKMNIY